MKETNLPPPYCSAICRNAMNDVCIESCAPEHDMSAFELQKGVELPELPRFPLDEFLEAMTPDERKTIMAVYMAKTVDYLQGRKEPNGQKLSSRGRTLYDRKRRLDNPQNIEVGGIRSDPEGEVVYQDRTESPSDPESLEEVS